MIIKKIQLNNITVFNDISIEFSTGLNVFIGKNGVGERYWEFISEITDKFICSFDIAEKMRLVYK